jgi:ABC-type bacteriocin/lantibiotic exporter with double-glycine peptidase domain
MQHVLLPVAHFPQLRTGECLPACTAMALTHLGVTVNYGQLIRLLGTIPGFGTPSFRLHNVVQALGINIEYGHGTLATLYKHLQQGHPPIAFVQTGQLPYWHEDVPHAVVVVGMNGREIYLNDPAFVQAPIAVPLGDFDLAWLERDEYYAVITD